MKRWKWLGMFAAFALVLAACSPAETGSSTTEGEPSDTTAAPTDTTAAPAMAGQGGELLLLQWQGASQANAYLSTGTKDLLASSLVLEPMARITPDGGIVPTLAAEIPTKENGGVAEDDMSITWTLQEGLVWSDGTPVTSADLVFTYEYCADPLTGCSSVLTTIESVEAVDDLTVTVNFTEPQSYPYGVFFVGFTSPVIQQAQFAECIGEAAKTCSEQNFAPVGTGPFMVTELRPEDTVTYAYNPNYRGAAEGKPFFGTVTIKGGGDAESAARSVLEIGEADYAWNLQVAPEIIAPMVAAGNGVTLTAFTANVEHILLNQTNPDGDPPSDYQGGANPNPFFTGNGELARALSMAINREELVAVGYGPSGAPTCTLWPVGDAKWPDESCLEYDPAGANEILDGLGYVDTDDDGVRELPDGTPLSWDYVTSTNAVRQSNQALVEAYWAEIGVDVNMQNQDAGLFFDGTNASDFSIWKFFTDIQMFTNGATAPDAVGYFDDLKTDQIPESTNSWGGGNVVRLASVEYDEAVTEAAALPVGDPRQIELLHFLQEEMFYGQGAIIPLIHRGNVSAFANDIQGVGELNGWDSEYWNIEEWTRG
jgi:peptide/nickel transport system substrate-binding protein